MYCVQCKLEERSTAQDARALGRLGNVLLQCHPELESLVGQGAACAAAPGEAPRDLEAELRKASATVSVQGRSVLSLCTRRNV